MPENLHAKGHKWLAGKQRAHGSKRVMYARLSASAWIPATIGRSEFNVPEAGGDAILRVETRDFIIGVRDLVLDGIEVEPQPGDRITEGDFVYEVSAPGAGVDHFSFADQFRNRYRIHTKFVSEFP